MTHFNNPAMQLKKIHIDSQARRKIKLNFELFHGLHRHPLSNNIHYRNACPCEKIVILTRRRRGVRICLQVMGQIMAKYRSVQITTRMKMLAVLLNDWMNMYILQRKSPRIQLEQKTTTSFLFVQAFAGLSGQEFRPQYS